MGASRSEDHAWWGAWTLEPGELRRWRVGPLALWVECRELEWRIHSREEDPADSDEPPQVEVAVRADPLSLDDVERQTVRIGRGAGARTISLTPIAADRPVVSRPQVPFSILPNEQARLFVSTPLWLRIAAEEQPLLEIPLVRPSDTWFGPSTIQGELCYASRSHCRLEVADVPLRAHRAVTPVTIANHAPTALLLERLSVPVPYLSLFHGSDGHLWTESIHVKRDGEKEGLAELEILEKPPFPDAVRVSAARARASESLIVRAFSSLF